MKITDISKWQQEIELAEKFKEDSFGKFDSKEHSKAGENIDYFERGFSNGGLIEDSSQTTLNIVHSITKNIVPSLYYQNPRILAFPKKSESQSTAPIVACTLNHYYKELDVEETNRKVIWDAYLLGHGYYKVGYATKFGMDIKDEKKPKTVLQRGLEALGLKKKEEQEVVHPELDYSIVSESPYISYVSPFDFLRDPRALTLEESMWVGQKFRRTVKYMKENKKYTNTKNLEGTIPDELNINKMRLTESQIEDFKTITLYEIHYRTDEGIYLLVVSNDKGNYEEHYHEKSPYEIDGWQFDELTFNKHGHSMFAISDISKILPLQDRFSATIDSILEQVDRLVPKIAFNGSELTPNGRKALEEGDVGALVETTRNPSEVFRELGFTQFKADLQALNNEIINIVTIQTGITKAQLTGVSAAQTATEATIEQGGQTLRISDMMQNVNRFSRRQAKKLWQVIKQFVDLEELQLINGVEGIDQETGAPKYNWLRVGTEQGVQMRTGNYDFDIEVGSSQKPDLSVVRKQFENLFSILARTDVITLMQQQGDKVVLSELLRMYLDLFPEAVKDKGRIIQKITMNTTGLIPPPVDKGGGTTSGSNFNAMEKQQGMPTPTIPSQIGQ